MPSYLKNVLKSFLFYFEVLLLSLNRSPPRRRDLSAPLLYNFEAVRVDIYFPCGKASLLLSFLMNAKRTHKSTCWGIGSFIISNTHVWQSSILFQIDPLFHYYKSDRPK